MRLQALEYDPRTGPFNSFNSQLLPSRPQTAADVPEGPIFVMGKVSSAVDCSRFGQLTKPWAAQVV